MSLCGACRFTHCSSLGCILKRALPVCLCLTLSQSLRCRAAPRARDWLNRSHTPRVPPRAAQRADKDLSKPTVELVCRTKCVGVWTVMRFCSFCGTRGTHRSSKRGLSSTCVDHSGEPPLVRCFLALSVSPRPGMKTPACEFVVPRPPCRHTAAPSHLHTTLD